VQADPELEAYTISIYIFIAAGGLIIIFTAIGILAAAQPNKIALIAVSCCRILHTGTS